MVLLHDLGLLYAQAAKDAGCPPDQLRNFCRAGVVLQSRQLAASAMARLCDLPGGPFEVGYGGAVGGGKSHWLLTQMGVDDCQRFPGLKCLLLRKVGKANKENFEDLRIRVLSRVPHKYNRSEGILTFSNGSRIVAGHFQNESDIDAYLGLEYDVIGIEEATTLTSSKHRNIKTRCRTSKAGWRPRVYSTTNPGGIGHVWYKTLFITPFQRGEEGATRFIPATVDDNAFIDPEYKGRLDELTGWQKAAWRYGDWDIAAGQYFSTWRADVHTNIDHVVIRPGWRVWGGFDYGFVHYTSAHIIAKDGDGNLYAMDEHAKQRWQPERHAGGLKAMCERHGLDATKLRWYAGSDVFSKDREGATVAETYLDYGIRLEQANTDRINGAAEILKRLGDVDAVDHNNQPAPIMPRLFVHKRCARLIETIPAMQHDPHDPEDVLKVDVDEDGLGGDDCYDDFRYGVMVDYRKPPERATVNPRTLSAKSGWTR